MNDAKDLFRWKRRSEPLVHGSDARTNKGSRTVEGVDIKIGAHDEVEKWLQRVEAATEVAALRTFDDSTIIGSTLPPTRLHRRLDNNVRFHEAKTDADFAEAQDLLDEWMTKNFIHQILGEDGDGDDLVVTNELRFDRSPSPTSPGLASTVARTVSSNVLLENLYDDIDAVDEDDVVQNIMENLLEAPIEENAAKVTKKTLKPKIRFDAETLEPKKLETRKTGGKSAMARMLEAEDKGVDMQKRIVDRHEQVRQNRLLRDRMIREEREKRRQVRELRREAEDMVAREAKEAETKRLVEEEKIEMEMTRIKKEMEERRAAEEEQRRKKVEEEIKKASEEEEKKNRDMQMREEIKLEQAARDRERNLKLQKLDIRVRNSHLRSLRTHFTAWRTLILDQRLQMGQARAIADWRLLMKSWFVWNGKYKTLWASQEGQKHLESLREGQRKLQKAETFYKRRLLSKCLGIWSVWVRHQQMDREFQREKEETQKKMEAFLKACAFGPEVDGDDTGLKEIVDTKNFEANLDGIVKTAKKSQSAKIKSLQPWQLNKEHVYEGIDLEKEAAAKKPIVKSKSTFVVDAYQHRHAAQEKMLKAQQEMIKEQQRMLEEMKLLQSQQKSRDVHFDDKVDQTNSTPKSPATVEAKIDHVILPAKNSQASNWTKHNKFIKDMEERARQRAERKAELERLKELRQKEKIEAQRRQEEEERSKEEEEKRKKMEEAREKRRAEREREEEKRKKAEEAKLIAETAVEHDRLRLMKWRGIVAWKNLVAGSRLRETKAENFSKIMTLKKVMSAWANLIESIKRERDLKAELCRRQQLQRRCFASWRGVKENTLRLEVAARTHWAQKSMLKLLNCWSEFVQEERLARWQQEKIAQEHRDKFLIQRAFTGWKLIPSMAKRERERENRKNLLRKKVSDLLPDYQGID